MAVNTRSVNGANVQPSPTPNIVEIFLTEELFPDESSRNKTIASCKSFWFQSIKILRGFLLDPTKLKTDLWTPLTFS